MRRPSDVIQLCVLAGNHCLSSRFRVSWLWLPYSLPTPTTYKKLDSD